MKFPSLEFVQALQERMNGDAAFHTASRWSDVKVLLCFGDQRLLAQALRGEDHLTQAVRQRSRPFGRRLEHFSNAGSNCYFT